MDISSYISIAEACPILGVNRQQATRLCREGKLPGARKIGRFHTSIRKFDGHRGGFPPFLIHSFHTSIRKFDKFRVIHNTL